MAEFNLRGRLRISVTREKLRIELLLLQIERSQEGPGHAGGTMSLGWPCLAVSPNEQKDVAAAREVWVSLLTQCDSGKCGKRTKRRPVLLFFRNKNIHGLNLANSNRVYVLVSVSHSSFSILWNCVSEFIIIQSTFCKKLFILNRAIKRDGTNLSSLKRLMLLWYFVSVIVALKYNDDGKYTELYDVWWTKRNSFTHSWITHTQTRNRRAHTFKKSESYY